jgi:hypothetical protein
MTGQAPWWVNVLWLAALLAVVFGAAWVAKVMERAEERERRERGRV